MVCVRQGEPEIRPNPGELHGRLLLGRHGGGTMWRSTSGSGERKRQLGDGKSVAGIPAPVIAIATMAIVMASNPPPKKRMAPTY